jgi:hypothetical protein
MFRAVNARSIDLARAECKKPPEGGLCGRTGNSYFGAEAASDAELIELIADEAAMPAEDAASIAEVAADEAAMPAEDAASVVDGAIVAGVVVLVVVVSSFLLQAAKETAAASVTMSSAVFIFLLDFRWFGQFPEIVGTSFGRGPHRSKTRKAMAFPVPNCSL